MAQQLLLLLAAVVGTSWANGEPADVADHTHKMWRIKTKGEARGLMNRVHFDSAHHLGSMSDSAASKLRENQGVLSVEEFTPSQKHRIHLNELDSRDTLQLHALHLNLDVKWPTLSIAHLVSTGNKTAVWECASVAWAACVRWVSSLHQVYYVEAIQKSQFKLLNAWSSGVTQSGEAHSTPLWAEGITGVGQIVGCGDTGIDIDSCLYWDNSHKRFPWDTLESNNRKIIKYITNFGDSGDGQHGHGSHVTGSIAGNAIGLDDHAAAGVSNFNGMAPDAKLIFTDVQASGASDGLSIPESLDGSDGGDGLLPIPYDDGARIHSNSWGSSTAAYTLYAQQIDSFVYDNPDMLVLVAAGNSGDDGVFSVGSPATCKNCLGVGATQNAQPAYEYVQMAVELQVQLPQICNLNGTTSANLTFEAVTSSFSAKVDTVKHAGLVVASPRDGCTALTGTGYSGNFVIIDRGTCAFTIKVLNAQRAGASAVIVTQNTDMPPFAMGGEPAEDVTIEAVMISKTAGATLQRRSDQCALVRNEHPVGESLWLTLDSTPPPGLTPGLWSGAMVFPQTLPSTGESAETVSCISFNCHTVDSDSRSSCSGWIDPIVDADGACNATGRIEFAFQLSGEGLLGYDIDMLFTSVDGENREVVSRAIGRWHDQVLEMVAIDFTCAADPWCPNTNDRPSHFQPGPGAFRQHMHMLYRPDGVPITNLTASTELEEFIHSNLNKTVLFSGLDASLEFVHSNKFNSTNLAGFSSRGPTLDGRIKPDVAAPGHTIYSTYSDGAAYSHQCGAGIGDKNSTLTTMSGTSMATPITAGSAALVRQYFADGWLAHSHEAPADSVSLSAPAAPDPANSFNASSALVRAVMVNCADDMLGYVQVASGGGSFKIPAAPSFYQGYGRIHLSNTLCLASYSADCSLFALDGPKLAAGVKESEGACFSNSTCLQSKAGWAFYETCENSVQWCPDGYWGIDMHECCPLACGDCSEEHRRGDESAASDVHTIRVDVAGGGKLKVTLTWTDPPGNPAAAHVLVNDLDLSVTEVSSGAVLIGNSGLYGTSGYPDSTNNQEQVVLLNTADQTVAYDVRVQVVAQNARYVEQDFALVLSSDKTGMIVQNNYPTDTCPADGDGVQCSGHGECDQGVCRCETGYVGANCALASCPSNCSGHGECNTETGRCECAALRFGPACEFGQCAGDMHMAIGTDGISSKFGATVMPASGDITGEGLDGGYGNGLNCSWNLEVPEGFFPELNFDYFATEQGYDFMTIYDSDGTELDKLSGDLPFVVPFVASGNSISVVFTSDVSVSKSGFRAWFQATKCAGGCSGQGQCQTHSAEEQTVEQCVCEVPYFGNRCEFDANIAIPCGLEENVSSTCSGHGTCNSGVCECSTGFYTLIPDFAIAAVEQCGEQVQCGLPYTETATNGSARISSERGPAGWSGECLFHLATGSDEGSTTYLAIANVAMGDGDSLMIEFGHPKQRIVVDSDSDNLDFTIPSGDVWVRMDIHGSYPQWSLMFYWSTEETAEVPTALPTFAPSSEGNDSGGDSVATGSPSEAPPSKLTRSHANGKVRLVGFISFDQVKDPGSAQYRNFVNMFESDIEQFETARGRNTYCTVQGLSNGSVIVDFTLTVLLGEPEEAITGLSDLQQAINDGSLVRLAGAPVDADTPILSDGNCAVCATCPTAAPFATEATSAPTDAAIDCIDNSNDMSTKSVTLGVFVGFGLLLCGGFTIYAVVFLYRQTNPKEGVVQGPSVVLNSNEEYGELPELEKEDIGTTMEVSDMGASRME